MFKVIELQAEADKLWDAALAKHCPTASVEWGDDGSCTVGGVMYFPSTFAEE